MSGSSSDKPSAPGQAPSTVTGAVPSTGSGTGTPRENWLVQGNAVASGALFEALAVGHPDVRLVDRIAGDVLLLQMTASRAGELKTQFATDLTVERDQPLDLFA